MPPMMKWSPFVLLLAFTPGVSGLHAVHDMPAARQRAGIVVTRIFTGPDGQSHAEEITVQLARGDVSTEISEMAKATGVQFRRQAPNFFEDWHTSPRKQYVITLSGRGEIELGDGKKVPLEPGCIFLLEDLTGRGHISRGVGTQERISMLIPLEK